MNEMNVAFKGKLALGIGEDGDYWAVCIDTGSGKVYWPAKGAAQSTLSQELVAHLIEQTAQRVVEILAARRIGVEP